LPLIPPLRLGASAALSRGGLELGLTAIWSDRQARLGAGELPTDGFTLLDLDLSYRANLAGRPVLLFMRGSNLLDEDARRHASPLKDYAPLPGRALGAGVRFEF
jgi:iron complex outermembrane receptor protein